MFRQLKKLFPSFQYINDCSRLPADYTCFISEDNQMVGIHKDELSSRDKSILSAFLQPYHSNIPEPTKEEDCWRKRINEENIKPEKTKPFRFIYFRIKEKLGKAEIFKEALHNLYAKRIPILWESEKEGIIIETEANIAEETIDYEMIIDVLMSDMYMNVNFLVGPYIQSLDKVHAYYHSIIREAKIAFSYSSQSVLTYKEAILYSMVHQMDHRFLKEVNSNLLKKHEKDAELLKTIQVFLESNLNTTLAAKKLHLHRNSLQYRLDKFIDKTGINIKNFKEAAVVYLLILFTMHKE